VKYAEPVSLSFHTNRYQSLRTINDRFSTRAVGEPRNATGADHDDPFWDDIMSTVPPS